MDGGNRGGPGADDRERGEVDTDADDRKLGDPAADGGKRVEVVRARGHENVTAAHDSTFEVTTDDWLTPAGDCILGVGADRAPAEFDPAFVAACRDADATVTATLTAGDRTATVVGRGDPALTFENDRSAVGRTSDYVDDRTVLVGADGAAADLDQELVAALANGADLTLRLTVERAGDGSMD